MINLYKSLSAIGLLALPLLTSCDGDDPENAGFGFTNSRFNATFLANNATTTASMPLFLVAGDEIQFVPNGATTSFDEDFAPVMSRHGATLTATGLNLITFERYQDPTLQNIFPALSASWNAGEGSPTASLTSVDSIDQDEIDLFTRFAFNNAESGGVFSNPFTDTNGDLDGDISSALEQAGLEFVNVTEAKGDLIQTELQSLGKEIYNNADSDVHIHDQVPYIDPALRVTMRRVFRFTATSTNADILANNQITGTYQIVEQYVHLYTHSELDDAAGYIRMELRPADGFSGEEVIETGNYTIQLQN